jgi:hypothetical protein
MSSKPSREHRASILAEWFRENAQICTADEGELMAQTAQMLERIAGRREHESLLANDVAPFQTSASAA